jgi:elongator complex protein 3
MVARNDAGGSAGYSSKGGRKPPPAGTEQERFVKACAEIAHVLIEEHDNPNPEGKNINLNVLRGQIAKKHRLKTVPPLTAIIAAIPEHYKKHITPKLLAKPISMVPDSKGDA